MKKIVSQKIKIKITFLMLILILIMPVAVAEFGREISDREIFDIKMLENIIKSRYIDREIEKGLYYLYQNQLPDGRFPVNISLSPNMNTSYNLFGNIVTFDTGLIIHTLNLLDNSCNQESTDKIDEMVYEMKNKSIAFLLDNKEQHGAWRFFGKNDPIPPDVDVTSVIFSAIIESGVNISDESLDYMLNYRTSEGFFYVWMNSREWLNETNPYYRQKFISNEIDPSVNINAIYAYSLRNRTQETKSAIKYITDILKNESFNGSGYYPSPYVFIYLVTKAYSEGNVTEFGPYLNKIREYLLGTQNPDGGWGNDLDTALATIALINIGYNGDELEKAVGHILYSQKDDGSWNIYSIYIAFEDPYPTVYFGSKELTTSFDIQALIKYNKMLKDSIMPNGIQLYQCEPIQAWNSSVEKT